ncbi:MAG: branched-chain amino acid transporter permease, partial [Rhizobacter sp.]|nr:branched-chain amino acid transporter permease [Rhizobacter sp.]
PTLRMSGLYLVVATIAFSQIVEEAAARWESVTGGNSGLTVSALKLAGAGFATPQRLFYVCVALAFAAWWLARNVMRTPIGRAMTAVRDSEIAARCMGISVARTKAVAFGLSALCCGVAGALYGQALGYISPEQFTIQLSLDLLMMVLVGGLASLPGVLFGALFIVMLPEAIRAVTSLLFPGTGEVQGMRPLTSGAILIAVMMFEQRGLYGLWLRLRTWVAAVPLYRRGSLSAQRGLIRSERW